jgi:hypothetical protein
MFLNVPSIFLNVPFREEEKRRRPATSNLSAEDQEIASSIAKLAETDQQDMVEVCHKRTIRSKPSSYGPSDQNPVLPRV